MRAMPPRGIGNRQSIPLEIHIPIVMQEANEELEQLLEVLNLAIVDEVEKFNVILTAAKDKMRDALFPAKEAFDLIDAQALEALHTEQAAAHKALAVAQAAFDEGIKAADKHYEEATYETSCDLQDVLVAVSREYDSVMKDARSVLRLKRETLIKEFRQAEHLIKQRVKRSGVRLVRHG